MSCSLQFIEDIKDEGNSKLLPLSLSSSSIMVEKSTTMIISQGVISSASSNYEVEDVLGWGTFGIVAQCKNLTTNETVALKLLQQKTAIAEAKTEVTAQTHHQ